MEKAVEMRKVTVPLAGLGTIEKRNGYWYDFSGVCYSGVVYEVVSVALTDFSAVSSDYPDT